MDLDASVSFVKISEALCFGRVERIEDAGDYLRGYADAGVLD